MVPSNLHAPFMLTPLPFLLVNARRGLTVLNLKSDWRFSGNPILTPVSFYSGYPIASASGLPMGALCVMDVNARREFSDEEKGLIRLAAEQVSYIVEENFAGNFLLKMNRLATTHELLKDQLCTVSRRSLPQLDPVSFSLAKPLNGNVGYMSFGGKDADLFSLDRCCQRIAAAMDLDAAYIVALSPGRDPMKASEVCSTAQTIAQSSNICPQHYHSGSGQCYMNAFDTLDEEDCVIYQNALDGVTLAPLPQAAGHASDQHFTCALVLPLTVWSKSTRQEVSSGHRSAGLSHPIKVRFALVAASLQPRHVLGIEDLRFLQSLRPHLLNAMQKCLKISGQAALRGQTSSRQRAHMPADLTQLPSKAHLDRIKSGHRVDSFVTPVENQLQSEPSTHRIPDASSDAARQPTLNFHGVGGDDGYRYFPNKAQPVSPGMKISAERGGHRDSNGQSSAATVQIPASSFGSKLIPMNIKRRTSGTGPLSRLSSPLNLMNAADSIRHTFHLQSRRSSNAKSSSSTSQTRGSGDSSSGMGRSWETGHLASSSIGTSISSEENHAKSPQEVHAHVFQGQSPRKESFTHKEQRGSLASSSSSSTTPVSTPAMRRIFEDEIKQAAIKDSSDGKSKVSSKKEGKSADVIERPHHPSLLSRFRRPMSAKSQQHEDDDGNKHMSLHSRPDLRSASSFAAVKFSSCDSLQDSHTRHYDALKRQVGVSAMPATVSAEAECTRCHGTVPVTKLSRPDARCSTTSSARRPRTAGEHPRERNYDVTEDRSVVEDCRRSPCTCIIPSPRTGQGEQWVNTGHLAAKAGPFEPDSIQAQQRCDRWIADMKKTQSQDSLRLDRISLDVSSTRVSDEDALELLLLDGDDLNDVEPSHHDASEHATAFESTEAVPLPLELGKIAYQQSTATQSLVSLPGHPRATIAVPMPTTVPMASKSIFPMRSDSSHSQQEGGSALLSTSSTDNVTAGPGLSPRPPITKIARVRH